MLGIWATSTGRQDVLLSTATEQISAMIVRPGKPWRARMGRSRLSGFGEVSRSWKSPANLTRNCMSGMGMVAEHVLSIHTVAVV